MNLGTPPKAPPVASGAKNPQPPQLANAKRKPRDPSLPPLTDRQKFVLGQVRAAKKACQLLTEKLNRAEDFSPSAAAACATLSAEYMSG